MAASTSVNSNALNFMSCLKSGVDPRTGLYNASISLPELQSNDLRGPGFNLDLSYSPLNMVDSGYGRGWNLQLSQYDPANSILALSTGETFRVNGTRGKELTMSEKKLDTFHFYQLDDTHYRVAHKSGLVEILKVYYSGNGRMAWPVKIIAPSGHSITLEHRPFDNTQFRLASITDDLDRVLLEIDRKATSVDLVLHPYAEPDTTPPALFSMKLSTSDRRVSSITLPGEQLASWRFEYRLTNDNQLMITRVDSPSGGREDIFYQDKGHEFPASANRPALPRVTQHVSDPGSGQAKIDVRYTYKDNQQRPYNFLGATLPIAWDDHDGLDNLYRYLQDYNYVCTESLWVDNKRVRSIERTFNRFHLQTLEITTQNGHQKTVATAYNIKAGISYDMQPNDCQLPRETVTRWQLLHEPARVRSETDTKTYDSHGNVLTHKRADGIEETSSWYPATQSDGCPADVEGFVCRLKEKTITPATGSQAGAPTLSTRYRYDAMRKLNGGEAADWIVPKSETQLQIADKQELELQHTVIDYIDDPAKPFQHGRTEQKTQTLNNNSTHTRYAYRTLPGVPMVSTTQTLETNFDAVRQTVVHQQSAWTGQNLLTRENGVETQYVYDALDRLTEETVAPGPDYEAKRTFEYTLCYNYGQQAEQILTNARGVKTRSCMDGLGRTISEERDHIDPSKPEALKPIFTAQYDNWSHLHQETAHDWLAGKELINTRFYGYDDCSHLHQETAHDWLAGKELINTRVYSYDDWNQQCCIATDDGVQAYDYSDPIGTDAHKGPVRKTWVQSSDLEPLISGRSETWLNLFGKPDRITNQHASGQELSHQTFLYDGLGRCTQQRDAGQNLTLLSYDNWSRLVSTTLPDNSVINRNYALHSASELPTELEVVHQDGITRTQAGRQEFDGLGRLTLAETGDRIERFTYVADQIQATSRKTANGEDINFNYTLALTDQIVASTAPDEKAEFDYDHVSARLTGAKNPQGERTYAYDEHNQLQEEAWLDRQGQTWKTVHQSSLQGRPIKRTDLKLGDTAGADTLYTYDTFGRVESIIQGNLLTTVTYDTLGQLATVTTRDLAAGTDAIIEMVYDDQGRETLRTQTAANLPVRTLTQVWQDDGLLGKRNLQQAGSPLLDETFSYDSRGRLTRVDYLGSALPKGEQAREIERQIFSFDDLDNMTLCQTSFVDKSTERAKYVYPEQDDPKHKDRCQLQEIIYTPHRATPNPTFSYDANGNQLNDEHGNSLHYDSQSRLQQVVKPDGTPINHYRYDAHGHLVAVREGKGSEVLRFYQGQQLSASVQDDRHMQYLHLDEQPLGQQVVGAPENTLLLLPDANESVLGECQQNQLRTAVYNAYGQRNPDHTLLGTAGFNGEVRETASGWYLPGNGYRAYNPGMMRFHSPDFLSPFAEGGVNPYTYCLGNPIALRDPTGHDASAQSGRLRRPDEDYLPQDVGGGFNIGAWVGVAVGVLFTVIGVVATVATLGVSAPVTGPLAVAGATTVTSSLSAVSATTIAYGVGTALGFGATVSLAVGAATNDERAYKASEYLGYAAIPFGLYGFGKTALSMAIAQANKMLASKLPASLRAAAAGLRRFNGSPGAGGGAGARSASLAVGPASAVSPPRGSINSVVSAGRAPSTGSASSASSSGSSGSSGSVNNARNRAGQTIQNSPGIGLRILRGWLPSRSGSYDLPQNDTRL